MNNPMLPLPGLSSASGKPVVVKFDGGLLSSDGGVLALREVEQRLRVADRLAACMIDPRAADQITHSLADVIRFRLLMISAGYEDGNDANALRRDPMFKMALDLFAHRSGVVLAVDNIAVGESAGRSRRAADGQGDGRSVLRVLRHGSQTDHAGHRRHVRCGPRWSAVAAVQRPLRRIRISADRRVRRRRPLRHRRASSRQAAERQGDQALPGSLLRAIRAHWPNTEILLRADSHYCGPEVLDWCRANGLDYILGIAPTATLRRHVEGLEASTKARFEAAAARWQASPFHGVLRRRAQSWSRVERIIARVEAGAEGPDTRFVVTNLSNRNLAGSTRMSIAGAARPKTISSPGRPIWRRIARPAPGRQPTSFELFLHAGAYWLMWGLRVSMPKRSMWRVAQFDTLRLRLIKIAARVVAAIRVALISLRR